MKPKFVTTAAIAVIGLGAFLAGRSSVSTPEAGKDGAIASSSRSRAGESRLGGGSGSGSSRADRGKSDTRGGSSSSERPATKEGRLAKLESIMRGDDPLARNRALLEYLDQLDPSELPDAIARFRELGITQERFGEYAMMLTAWAKADPTAALAYAKDNTRGGFAMNSILSTWARTDPDAAIAWAQTNHDATKGENPYLAGIIRGIASTDPAKATTLLTGMGFSAERGEALAGLLPHILSQSPESAREWIASIQDEKLRNGAIERTADELAKKDPKGTADWLLSNPGDAANSNMDNVLATWHGKDSAAAVAYYQSLPSGDARSNALRGLVNSMAGENPKAAAAFMDSHPADITDRGVQQLVWHSMEKDPNLAIDYIAKMTDQNTRDGMYRRTIDNWMNNDEAAARAYLQTHAMPQTLNGYVQKKLGR